MKILLTGATGFIGSRLTEMLLAEGHELRVTTRDPEAARKKMDRRIQVVGWVPAAGTNVEDTDAIIHLAGAPVGDRRWTPEVKAEMASSRIDSTSALVNSIALAKARPRVLISASGIGYYGNRGDESLTEESGPGSDMMAGVCRDWEAAALGAEKFGVRVACMRIGIVLGSHGGVLAQMLPVFKAYMGGTLGSGRQWMSWIELEDLCRMLVWALKDESVHGPLNCTAPEPVTNEAFTRALAAALGRPAWFKIPPFALRLALGELADAALGGQKVLSSKAAGLGFQFHCPRLETALRASLA